MEIIKDILKELDIDAPPGATESELSDFEHDTGLQLPESVRALYATCNGVVLRDGQLEILSLAGVRQHLDGFDQFGIPERWGYFPLTDNNDSNPFCVCCSTP